MFVWTTSTHLAFQLLQNVVIVDNFDNIYFLYQQSEVPKTTQYNPEERSTFTKEKTLQTDIEVKKAKTIKVCIA